MKFWDLRHRNLLLSGVLCVSFYLLSFGAFVPILCYAERPQEDDQFKTTELFGDLNFERGFKVVNGGKELGVLHLPAPGVDAEQDSKDAPTWALAQHASKYNLSEGTFQRSETCSSVSTPGQRVAIEKDKSGVLTLFLDVATDKEYAAPRKNGEWWIHLLLVRDFPPVERISFDDSTKSLVFSCDARVFDWKRLMTEDEFNANLHATQASVYFAISNDDPDSPDYRDYIWFGVSFFDDRTEVQSNYIEIDGDPKTIGTGKLIYRLGDQKTIDDLLGGVNPYSKEWTHIEIDLKKYVDGMLAAARERGLLKNTKPEQLKVSHFNFGWETPGTYRASLGIKNLKLTATQTK